MDPLQQQKTRFLLALSLSPVSSARIIRYVRIKYMRKRDSASILFSITFIRLLVYFHCFVPRLWIRTQGLYRIVGLEIIFSIVLQPTKCLHVARCQIEYSAQSAPRSARVPFLHPSISQIDVPDCCMQIHQCLVRYGFCVRCVLNVRIVR